MDLPGEGEEGGMRQLAKGEEGGASTSHGRLGAEGFHSEAEKY